MAFEGEQVFTVSGRSGPKMKSRQVYFGITFFRKYKISSFDPRRKIILCAFPFEKREFGCEIITTLNNILWN